MFRFEKSVIFFLCKQKEKHFEVSEFKWNKKFLLINATKYNVTQLFLKADLETASSFVFM